MLSKSRFSKKFLFQVYFRQSINYLGSFLIGFQNKAYGRLLVKWLLLPGRRFEMCIDTDQQQLLQHYRQIDVPEIIYVLLNIFSVLGYLLALLLFLFKLNGMDGK